MEFLTPEREEAILRITVPFQQIIESLEPKSIDQPQLEATPELSRTIGDIVAVRKEVRDLLDGLTGWVFMRGEILAGGLGEAKARVAMLQHFLVASHINHTKASGNQADENRSRMIAYHAISKMIEAVVGQYILTLRDESPDDYETLYREVEAGIALERLTMTELKDDPDDYDRDTMGSDLLKEKPDLVIGQISDEVTRHIEDLLGIQRYV